MVIICTINLFTFVLQFTCPYTVEEAIEYYETAEPIINVELPIEEIESPFGNNSPPSRGTGVVPSWSSWSSWTSSDSTCFGWCTRTRNGYVRPRRCRTQRSKCRKFQTFFNQKQQTD